MLVIDNICKKVLSNGQLTKPKLIFIHDIVNIDNWINVIVNDANEGGQ